MKITSIDQKHSTPYWIACHTDGHISADVAKHFQSLYAQRMEAGGIQVEVRDSLVLIQAGKWPAGFTDFVSQVLTQAEGLFAHEKDIARQKEQLATDQKNDMLKDVAKSQNLPIV